MGTPRPPAPRREEKKAKPESDPEARADSRSRGREEWPGTSEASDGGETHRDRPGERPAASYLLSCVPPISPTQRTRPRVGARGGGESGPGRERKRARADLGVVGRVRPRRKAESAGGAKAPEKSGTRCNRSWRGGVVSPVFSPASPLPGRKAEAQSRDVGIGPDRGGGSEGRISSLRRPRTEVLGRGVSVVTETQGGALTL
ncbi:hypothetical protein NDU88_005775 [Pleurodeles waltl]|uniref:Uncharacterized protein n=1 Tax=Pleurodeles waltl TaxID=8319 RepID=A0AAV7TWK1_PLEWA|nr:hypothetical protein NDU88_005775 [Pleurodeles waltl]